MRVRAIDASGDITFGSGAQNYLANSNAAVGQAIYTALVLFLGEWFLDTSAGVAWLTNVVGVDTADTYDATIKNAISNVTGVASITSYASVRTGTNLSVSVSVETIFGTTVTVNNIQVSLPPGGWGSGGFGSPTY